MCIIAIKPVGKKMFSKAMITTMFTNNPDGCGYCYYDKDSKKVVISKGFMTLTELLNDLKGKDFKDTNLIMHFRISTSGKVDSLNCHPYPIYQTNKTSCKTTLAMAHNGVLTDYTPRKDSPINDTQTFIKSVLSKLKNGFLYDDDKRGLIGELIGPRNKLAFLDSKNNVFLIGDFVNNDGYVFSNYSFREKTVPTKSVCADKSPAKSTVKSHTKSVSVPPKDKTYTPKCAYSVRYNDPRYDSFWGDEDDKDDFWDWFDEKYLY